MNSCLFWIYTGGFGVGLTQSRLCPSQSQTMASKFWAHESGASGSDSDSDSDSDSSMGATGGGAGARRQWAVDSDSESEEEVTVWSVPEQD